MATPVEVKTISTSTKYFVLPKAIKIDPMTPQAELMAEILRLELEAVTKKKVPWLNKTEKEIQADNMESVKKELN